MIAQDYSIPDWLREYKYVKWELPDPDYATEEDASKDIQGIKKKVESLL
jgi:protein-tyrosine-phosphatase